MLIAQTRTSVGNVLAYVLYQRLKSTNLIHFHIIKIITVFGKHKSKDKTNLFHNFHKADPTSLFATQ